MSGCPCGCIAPVGLPGIIAVRARRPVPLSRAYAAEPADPGLLIDDLVAANRILYDQVSMGSACPGVRHDKDPGRYLLSRSMALPW